MLKTNLSYPERIVWLHTRLIQLQQFPVWRPATPEKLSVIFVAFWLGAVPIQCPQSTRSFNYSINQSLFQAQAHTNKRIQDRMKNRQVTKIVILMTASRFDVVSSDVGRCVTSPLTDAEKHCKVAKEYCRSVANVRTLSAKHNVIQFICWRASRQMSPTRFTSSNSK